MAMYDTVLPQLFAEVKSIKITFEMAYDHRDYLRREVDSTIRVKNPALPVDKSAAPVTAWATGKVNTVSDGTCSSRPLSGVYLSSISPMVYVITV